MKFKFPILLFRILISDCFSGSVLGFEKNPIEEPKIPSMMEVGNGKNWLKWESRCDYDVEGEKGVLL